MPLLMCPNCQASMQAVQRSGVEFDMCPNCRGVWLDRGELEKLVGMAREPEQATPAQFQPQPQNQPQPNYPPQTYQPRPQKQSDYHGRKYDDDDDYKYRHKKKRGFDIFDIFD